MIARRGVSFFPVVLWMEIAVMYACESIKQVVPHIKHLDMEIR